MLRKLELIVGNILGFLIYLTRFKVHIVKKNLKNSGLYSKSEIRKICFKNYLHYGNLIIEFIHLVISPMHFVANYVRGENFKYLFDVIRRGKGVFLLVGHIGNWEVSAWYGIYRGVKLNVITKSIKNKLFQFIWSQNRLKRGMELIYADTSSGGFKLVKAIKNGEVISYILDQHTYPPHGIKLDFFSNQAWTLSALSKYVQKFSTPVIPVSCYRGKDGVFDIRIEEELLFISKEDKSTEIYENTLNYTKCLEKMIITKAEQWIWLHKRWKKID